MFESRMGLGRKALTLAGLGLAFAVVSAPGIAQRESRPKDPRTDIVPRYSWPKRAEGVLTGDYTNHTARSSSGDKFSFEYIKTISLGFYSKDFGAGIKWEFISDGPITYNYSVPFKADFVFPQKVYPGQVIYLDPTFAWGKLNPVSGQGSRALPPSIMAFQDYSFSHKSTAWADAPDGLDVLSATFTQMSAKANITVKIPILPGLDALEGSFDCTFPPCSSGGGDYGGSYTKLGGTGNLTNSGFDSINETSTEISLRVWGTSQPAWKQGHEQFKLAASVLEMIPTPATAAAAAGIELSREIGKFRLNTDLDASIHRHDIIHIRIDEVGPINVPSNLQGDAWGFDIPVRVKYSIQFYSAFNFPMGYNVTFDMRTIDQQELAHEDLMYVSGGSSSSDWIEREGVFGVSGTVPVEARPQVVPKSRPVRPNNTMRKDTPPPPPAGVKLASLEDTRRSLRTKATLTFPKPATPQSGQYTVVLGRYSETGAIRIVDDLKGKGIEVLVLPVRGTREKIVTFGSFRKEDEARFASDMLNEILNVASVVTSDPYGFRPTKRTGEPRIRSGKASSPVEFGQE